MKSFRPRVKISLSHLQSVIFTEQCAMSSILFVAYCSSAKELTQCFWSRTWIILLGVSTRPSGMLACERFRNAVKMKAFNSLAFVSMSVL